MRGAATLNMGRGKLVLPGWGFMRVGARAWDHNRITMGRGARPARTRVPGSEDGSKALAIGLLANTVLNLSRAVANPIQG
jgi:hypothetical protein